MANVTLKDNAIHTGGELPRSAARIRTALAIAASSYRSGYITTNLLFILVAMGGLEPPTSAL